MSPRVVFDLRCGLLGCEYALGGFERWSPRRSVVARAGGGGVEAAGGVDDVGGVAEKGGEFVGPLAGGETVSIIDRAVVDPGNGPVFRGGVVVVPDFEVFGDAAPGGESASAGGGLAERRPEFVGGIGCGGRDAVGRVWSRAS